MKLSPPPTPGLPGPDRPDPKRKALLDYHESSAGKEHRIDHRETAKIFACKRKNP